MKKAGQLSKEHQNNNKVKLFLLFIHLLSVDYDAHQNNGKGYFRLMSTSRIEEQLAEYIIQNQERYYRLAYSYVRNADDALDIIQDSIYKAISSIGSLKNSNSMNTWFYKIIINTSLEFLRKRGKLVVVDETDLETHESASFDVCKNIDLQRALDDLPDNYRTIVVLRYFEDLPLKDIAEIMDENINTIKTRLYKALKKMQITMVS